MMAFRIRRKPDPSVPEKDDVTSSVVRATGALVDDIHAEMERLSHTLQRMQNDPESALYRPPAAQRTGLPHGSR